MRHALFGLGVTIVAGVVAIVVASATWIFLEAWSGANPDASRALLAGFSGAFFAFLFVRIGDGLTRIYDRKAKNNATLVRLQHYFNDCLNITGDNVYVANFVLQLFDDKRLQSGELAICTNRFQQYPIEGELLLGLTNQDYLNDVYTLNVELRKLNDSMAMTDRAYEHVMEAFISKKIEPQNYIENVRHSRPRYQELKEFLLETKKDLIRLFAASNLLIQEAPFLVRAIRSLTKSKYSRAFERKLQREVERVGAELEEGAEKSRSRITKVAERVAQPGAAADRPQAGGR